MPPPVDQSDIQSLIRRSYGGSDSTAPSFLRPQYVKFNSLSKSKDFGTVENFSAVMTGSVGGHVGKPTVFFRVHTLGPARVGIRKQSLNRIDDRLIAVGILDGDHNPLPLNERGFAVVSKIHNSSQDDNVERLPAGTYFFTISTNQWREIPFSVVAVVQRNLELRGAAWGAMAPTLRLALVKLVGAAEALAPLRGTVFNPAKARSLRGSAVGTNTAQITLTIMRGAAIGRMLPYGRLQQNYRISGAALGSNANLATMTSRRPTGYGY